MAHTSSYITLLIVLALLASLAMNLGTPWYIGIGIFLLAYLVLALKVNKEWERAIILRLGKYDRTQPQGLFLIVPIIEALYRVDLRTRVMDVIPQKIITKDSVTVDVDAIVYYHIRVKDFEKSILNVEEVHDASTKLAQTTLRDIIGKHDLDDLLTKKQELGNEIKKILDKATDPWAITVETVEIRDVIIPGEMERAMAKEAEAIREKRARIIKADGEKIASKILRDAGAELTKNPSALKIRQLQTWSEIGAEQNSLIIVVPEERLKDQMSLVAIGKGELDRMAKKEMPKKTRRT